MSPTRYFSSHWLALSAAIAAAAAGFTGCSTVTTAPANTQLAGHWSRDKSASDDVDAKVAAVIARAQQQLRRRLRSAGYGGPGGPAESGGENAPAGPDSPDESFDLPTDRYGGPGQLGPDFRGIRARLLQALMPPAALQIEVEGDLVRLTADQLPPREYRLGERISRFDEYGTATIDASWSHQTFILSWHYTSHGTRSERYEVDPASGALTLTQQIRDPNVGQIVLNSVYRRR